jgi:murein DD-endopeptidase MepM/ murein hydrolase activator NlpD
MSMSSLLVFLASVVLAQQGQAVRLAIPNEPGIQSVEIQWQGRRVPYVHVREEWVGVLGIDLDTKPAVYTSQIKIAKNGTVERRTVTIDVRREKFPTTELKVADEYVELSPENLKRATAETKELDEIHGKISDAALWTEPFVSPIPGETGTNFGHRRVFNGQPRAPHAGADLHATTGTPIHSANRGRVVLAKDLFFTGNTVIVDHGLGVYTLYAHLSRIDVEKGAMVERGELLGLAGATGRVTGPHLHWGARVQNARVDPFTLIKMAW